MRPPAPPPPAPPPLAHVAGGGDEYSVAAFEREALLRAVKRQQARNQYAWSLPFAVVSYVLFCASLVLHVQVERAHELETGLLQSVVGGTATTPLRSVGDLYAFLAADVVTQFYPPAGAPAARGTINSYGRVVGGLRLGQRRSAVADSPFQEYFHRLSRPCYPATTDSYAAFGDAAAAAAANVSAAFTPQSPADLAAGGSAADPFQLVLPADEAPAAAAAVVPGLAAAGWLDAQTKAVAAEAAVLNLDVAAWARVRIAFDLTRGGRIDVTHTVASIPIDPYYGQLGLRFFDVLNLMYLAVLLAQNVFNVAVTARKVRHLVRDGVGVAAAVARAADVWLAVDVGASLSFGSTAILWARVVTALDALQTAVGARDFAPGPALSADTAATQALLAAALQQYADFKTAACATLVFLTLRLFWQFSLQPRLAVMTECLSRAAGDIAHFGFLFAIVLASYCVWGHVTYGRQLDDWRSLGASSFAIVRMCMYDYDLAGMQSVDASATAALYASFMFLITNLVLWMFLAIVMETYSAVRTEAHGSPSAVADLWAGLRALPAQVRAGAGCSEAARPPAGGAIDLDGGDEEGDGAGAAAASGGRAGGDVEAATVEGAGGPALPRGHVVVAARARPLPSLAAVEAALIRPPLVDQRVVTLSGIGAALHRPAVDAARALAGVATLAAARAGVAGVASPLDGGGGGGGGGGASRLWWRAAARPVAPETHAPSYDANSCAGRGGDDGTAASGAQLAALVALLEAAASAAAAVTAATAAGKGVSGGAAARGRGGDRLAVTQAALDSALSAARRGAAAATGVTSAPPAASDAPLVAMAAAAEAVRAGTPTGGVARRRGPGGAAVGTDADGGATVVGSASAGSASPPAAAAPQRPSSAPPPAAAGPQRPASAPPPAAPDSAATGDVSLSDFQPSESWGGAAGAAAFEPFAADGGAGEAAPASSAAVGAAEGFAAVADAPAPLPDTAAVEAGARVLGGPNARG